MDCINYVIIIIIVMDTWDPQKSRYLIHIIIICLTHCFHNQPLFDKNHLVATYILRGYGPQITQHICMDVQVKGNIIIKYNLICMYLPILIYLNAI